jgi:DNA helicase-2/ATP-dependent DNA helicase PcrA
LSEIRLNRQQLAAVQAPPDKPAIVVASPGSGKTAVLTLRVAHLISEYDADPNTIVVTTFTKRAAEEMKERLQPLIGSAATRLQIGTIHSVCLRILREEGMARDVISSYEQKKVIQEELGYKRLNWDVGWRYPLGWIMKAKAALVTPRQAQDWLFQRLESLSGNRWQAMDLAQKLARVYRAYEEEKRYLGRMDFADMLTWTAQKLFNDDEFRARWQSRVQYVLVDEVQDTGSLPYSILRTLASPENRFFAVGDPDQSLFTWNGADPEHNIFGFRELFPDGLVLPLEINYRSTKTIVATAAKAISRNYEGASEARLTYKKTLKARPGAPDGLPVGVQEYADVSEEASGVVTAIEGMLNNGRQPQDIYVVYRVNSQSRAIEDELLRHRIPYVIQGSLGFYDRKVVKDMLAYLSLVDDENDDEAFQRVANIATADFFRPTRGFGSRWMHECSALAKGHGESMWKAMLRMKSRQARWQKEAIDDLVNMVEDVRERSEGDPRKSLMMVREQCYQPFLLRTEGVDEATAQEEGLFDDLDELCYAAGQFKSIKEFLKHVEMIRQMQARQDKERVNAVVLTTIHRVKGLERPVVFGVGLAENILPHRYALDGGGNKEALPVENLSGVEDERCAVFVLVSRAKEELHLSYPLQYRNQEMSPSRFLYEMELVREAQEEAAEARIGASV